MKSIRARSGPFSERPHFKNGEIERTCVQELRAVSLLPDKPAPIRVDRFIERRFKVAPSYEQLPEGVLGYTKFGKQGVEAVVISEQLDNDTVDHIRRRLRSTLAHEAGHALLHAFLFALGTKPMSLFGETDAKPEILCRDVEGEGKRSGYDGRWWEYQANRAIGGLLLPTPLVLRACEPFLEPAGSLGIKQLPADQREKAARALSDLFDANAAVTRIRLSDLFPQNEGGIGEPLF